MFYFNCLYHLSDCHTLPDSTNGRVTDNKILCRFACVSCPFHMRWMRSMSGDIRFVRSYPLASFRHVQNFERTPPDKYVRWMNVTYALVCGLSGSQAVCPNLIVSASCRYPVCIRWCPFDLSCEWSITGKVRDFHGWVPHAHSVFVQRTFCLFLIWYIFILSIIHLLHVR